MTDPGDLTAAARAFPVERAHRHELRAGGRESLAHMLMLPEHGLAGFVYPTMRESGGPEFCWNRASFEYAKGHVERYGASAV